MLGDRTVVITGLGVMASIGCGRTVFWESLVSGKSGVRRTQAFDPRHHRSQIASEVLSFQPETYLTHKKIRRMVRVSQLAVAGAIEAVRDAGLDIPAYEETLSRAARPPAAVRIVQQTTLPPLGVMSDPATWWQVVLFEVTYGAGEPVPISGGRGSVADSLQRQAQ